MGDRRKGVDVIFPYLSVLVALPTVGAILVKAVGGRARAREIALLVALLEAGLAIAMAIQFDPARS